MCVCEREKEEWNEKVRSSLEEGEGGGGSKYGPEKEGEVENARKGGRKREKKIKIIQK